MLYSQRATPRLYAYLLKRVSVGLKAVVPSALIATGPISEPSELALLGRLGIGPYVDVVSLDGRLPTNEALRTARAAMPGVRSGWTERAMERRRTCSRPPAPWPAPLPLSWQVPARNRSRGAWPNGAGCSARRL